jgi:hypothetical protein
MLPEFAHSLHERFVREGIPLLLAGGWAVCHHGYSRLTSDVDWICSRADETRAIEWPRKFFSVKVADDFFLKVFGFVFRFVFC